MAYRFPDYEDDHHTIDHGAFRLEGWLREPYDDEGLDRRDPWASKLGGAIARPASPIAREWELTAEALGRFWRRPDGASALTSSAWTADNDQDERSSGTTGTRLDATRVFLDEMMTRRGQDMIVEVQLKGPRESPRSRLKPEDGDGRIKITEIFVVAVGRRPLGFRFDP